MSRIHATIAPVACTLSNLTAFTADPDTLETIVRQDEPLGLQVMVEFERSGAIALMPLALPIRVRFFAKPLGMGETIEVGTAIATTKAHVFVYTPTLRLDKGPATVGFVAETIYSISAVLLVGAEGYPAFVYGAIEHLSIQTYCL